MRHVFAEAVDDGLKGKGWVLQGGRQDVVDSEVDGLFVQIVLKDDEAVLKSRGGRENRVEVADDGGSVDHTARNLPICGCTQLVHGSKEWCTHL